VHTEESSRKRRRLATPADRSSAAAAGTAPSIISLIVASFFAALATLASLALVLEHLAGMSLPGCGEGSPCAQAAASVWGRVKLGSFEWPVAYLGLAYFLAALITWLALRGAVSPAFRYLVRLGALISLGFCAIIVATRMVCYYCLAAHLANFAFWITIELAAIRPARPHRAAVVLGSVFALTSLVLGIWDASHRGAVAERAEQDRSAAAQEIIERSRQIVSGPTPSPAPAPAPAPSQSPDATPLDSAGAQRPQPPSPGQPRQAPVAAAPQPEQVEPAPDASPDAGPPMFTGRYRVGPAEAPIRIVCFTDYQCRDCYNIEKQLVKLYETRDDISISIKHFPFNADCNPGAARTLHPNACWAARAAEAAGKLWGPEGFWKMHVWLFERRGEFQNLEELETAIREFGYDPAGFAETMGSPQILEVIKADAVEAKQLGLYFTPMIFINGVELKGWMAPNALIRTVEQVAATNPPPRSAAYDQPPMAFEKYVADWRDGKQIKLPSDKQAWTLGTPDAPVEIVLWGDYQEHYTSRADAVIRQFVAQHNNVRYTYRHYPFNSDCNPNLKDRRFPNACLAAKAAEAAGILGGNEGYWKMHTWLFEHRQDLTEESLSAAAAELGFGAAMLLAAMEQSEVQDNIQDDIDAAKKLPVLRYGTPPGLHSIPTVFVNGRHIPRWELGDQPVLETILKEAAQ